MGERRSTGQVPNVMHKKHGAGVVGMCSEFGCLVDFLGGGPWKVVNKNDLTPIGQGDVAAMIGEHVVDAKD